ncbi:hypothetical protein QR680_005158 [Steinernema hermaphroditum]|uniref:Radical SAM core domain-containing protein n=1 Tax=Steinernema hermaphroditum TaxID=289476 RepID=A0AA39HR22_9BILA|nr:hypothetical protein QR680_005158 [Steinernema hermaphroditum]
MRRVIYSTLVSRLSTSASTSQCRLKAAPLPELLSPSSTPSIVEKSTQHPLLDNFQRQHTYLRISLTERCNLRCTYCMPEEGVPLSPSEKLLSADEIVRLATLFAEFGVDKIRLTGGEPTVRKDLVEIVGRLAKVPGIRQIGMTSNGIVLARKLDALAAAGLTKLNVSLDTLVDHKYQIMTRRNGLAKVLHLIEVAEHMFDQLKINCVVIRGTNDDEVLDFVRLTEKKNLDVRFIEYMPFGGNRFDVRKMVPYKEMLKTIVDHFQEVVRLRDAPNDTSKAFGVHGFRGKFGFISSMSEHFCGTCNRLRLTADGNLKGRQRRRARGGHRKRRPEEEEAARRNRHSDGDEESTDDSNRWVNDRPSSPLHLPLRSLPPLHPALFSRSQAPPRVFSNRLFCSSSRLTHVDAEGKATMVDVSSKTPTFRMALARSEVLVTPSIMQALLENRVAKGDALAVARIAGISAAKMTSDLIPLCHNIPLSAVKVEFRLLDDEHKVEILARVKTKFETGVEMEALTAASVAGLVVYDMCKAMSHEMVLGPTTLLGKRGGKRDFGVVDFEDA